MPFAPNESVRNRIRLGLDLYDKRSQRASSLTLPDRKRLEVARALATDPKLLLLDEVMAGLRPTETDRMVAILQGLNRDTGLTILLIEHVMRAVMALASRILVLHHGAAIAEGLPEEVIRRYPLGSVPSRSPVRNSAHSPLHPLNARWQESRRSPTGCR